MGNFNLNTVYYLESPDRNQFIKSAILKNQNEFLEKYWLRFAAAAGITINLQWVEVKFMSLKTEIQLRIHCTRVHSLKFFFFSRFIVV